MPQDRLPREADGSPRRRRSPFPRAAPDAEPVLERAIEQRYGSALAAVDQLRRAHPQDSPAELADRLIRRYAKDMAIGGAVAGGAAAAPVAGMAVAAASAGVESAYSVGRLGELIMAIGLLYGHSPTNVDERRAAVLAVMGMADGAAVGVSGLAARAGSRGSARILRRLPGVGVGAAATGGVAARGVGRRAVARMASSRGPWSLAALVPYGIGAGVGAAGNALLVRAVGRAAKEYYAAKDAGHTDADRLEDAWDAEVVDAEIVEDEPIDGEPVDGG